MSFFLFVFFFLWWGEGDCSVSKFDREKKFCLLHVQKKNSEGERNCAEKPSLFFFNNLQIRLNVLLTVNRPKPTAVYNI